MTVRSLNTAQFRKSRICADKHCVEVASTGDIVGVRDSTDNGRGATLAFTASQWNSFLTSAKARAPRITGF